MAIENVKEYEVVEHRALPDIGSEGYLLRHKKSGARLFLVSNQDYNKVFSIGFRTPPVDNTGMTHILEHSVLCGSREFPVKDPFVELAKGSLNTFLNAMTYPDKTVYPVASTNDKDFQNLVHVYLDAVFYPDIYQKEEIFRQEGWHYELPSEDAPLTVNGVVYNEMKGVFSSPEGILDRDIENSLFPDTPYGLESGGDPDEIPQLAYGQFLHYHSIWYHPSNSYIYLYGDMDMEEKLRWMDEKYLSHFEKKEIDTKVPMQQPFEKTRYLRKYYPVTEGEDTEKKTFLSYNFACGSTLDENLYTALEVLDYVLVSSPGAPIKRALLDAGIGSDIDSTTENGILQPMFSITAKNADPQQEGQFVSIIRQEMERLVKEGLDQKAILGCINSLEFRYREADFGRFPIGLSYGLQIMDSWLYDEKDPFMHLEQNRVFAYLKEHLSDGYFEGLVKKYFLDNPHSTVLTLEPKKGMGARAEKEKAKKLASYKASLSQEEIRKLVEDTRHLKEYQGTPSTQEELKTIPLLAREDIEKKARPFVNRMDEESGIPVLCHDIETNQIAYVDLSFNADGLPMEELPYLGLLPSVLGYVDTASYSYEGLATEINLHTGGIDSRVSVYTDQSKERKAHTRYVVYGKALFQEIPKMFELMKEILFTSNLRMEKRLHEILEELRTSLSVQAIESGHTFAAMRGMGYFSESSRRIDLVNGLGFYQAVKGFCKEYEEKPEDVMGHLERICHFLLRKENLLVSVTAGEGAGQQVHAEVKALAQAFPDEKEDKETLFPGEGASFEKEKKNEGFCTASKINYVARCGNFRDHGFEFTGALNVFKIIMSYDYMWIRIRVKGGAYGCMCSQSRDGDSYFVSYRDPHVKETNEIYDGIPQYLENFNCDDRDMLKYIIGTVSMLDTPLNPSAQGSRSLNAYLTGITLEQVQRERDQVLSCTQEDIRALAPLIASVLSDGYICAIGDEGKILEEKDLFGSIKPLQ